mgnify:FL=1
MMNNSWNKIIYKVWSPVYDQIFHSGIFFKARKRVFQETTFKSGQNILFIGIGTGADLELINHSEFNITAIDISLDMLEKARRKFNNSSIKFLEMDAQQMEFRNESFDCVVASLVLSVVPDANKCFQEMARVLKREGNIIIFDKFAPKNKRLSLPMLILRPVIKVLGTDIGVNFEQLFFKNNKNLQIEADQPVMLNGMYRKIIIRKL